MLLWSFLKLDGDSGEGMFDARLIRGALGQDVRGIENWCAVGLEPGTLVNLVISGLT